MGVLTSTDGCAYPLDALPVGRAYLLDGKGALRESATQIDPVKKKGRSPTEDPGNPEQIVELGSRGSGGAIVIVNIIRRIAGKLRRIILLHFGLVAFRLHYRRNRKQNLHDLGSFGTPGNPYSWI